MLVIEEAVRDAIVAHAKRDHPDEACGVVAGAAGSDRATRFVPMANASSDPYILYEFSSADLFRLYREMDDRGEEPVVIYHSHTHTEAYPSPTDRRLASEPGPITSWSPPASTAVSPARWTSARTGSSTARSPKRT